MNAWFMGQLEILVYFPSEYWIPPLSSAASVSSDSFFSVPQTRKICVFFYFIAIPVTLCTYYTRLSLSGVKYMKMRIYILWFCPPFLQYVLPATECLFYSLHSPVPPRSYFYLLCSLFIIILYRIIIQRGLSMSIPEYKYNLIF